jgi:VIT1/CCC1 family predicted Fe2+/Mn2+ transporter
LIHGVGYVSSTNHWSNVYDSWSMCVRGTCQDELGINDSTRAKPLQAAMASLGSFVFGALLPFVISIFAPLAYMVYIQYLLSIIFLMILGAIAAKTGGSIISTAVLRIAFWGTAAMAITALVGHLFGVNIS